MSSLLQDTFNRADGALGGDWTVSLGTIDISSNRLRVHTSNSSAYLPLPSSAQTDCRVTLTLPAANGWSGSYGFRVQLRSNAAGSTGYRFNITPGADGAASVQLTARVNPNSYDLGTLYQFTLATGAHTITCEAIGTLLSCYLDGQCILSISDSRINTGGYLFINGSGVDQWYVDQLDVDSASESGMSIYPTTVPPSRVGTTLILTGFGTTWTPGVPGSPTFTASAGTITYQHILSATQATLVWDAPATAGPVTFTDPDTSDTATVQVTTSPVPPWAGGADPYGILKALEYYLIPLNVIEHILGADVTNDYIALLRDELGIADDALPTVGNVKALLAALEPLSRDILTDADDPTTLRSILVDTLAEAFYISGNTTNNLGTVLTAIDNIDAGGSGEVLAAVAALSDLLTTTLAELYTLDGFPSRTTTTDLSLAIAAIESQITALGTALIAPIGVDVGALAEIVAAFRDETSSTLALVGADAHSADTHATAGAASAAAAVIAIAAVALSVGLGFGSVEASLVAQTLEINAATAVATGVTDAAVGALEGAQSLSFFGVNQTLNGLSSDLADAQASLDRIETALADRSAQPASWPGIVGVTILDVVEHTGSAVIDGPMDGAVFDCSVYPQSKVGWTVGGVTNLERCGFFVFTDADGYCDDRQPLAFPHMVMTPKRLLRPAHLVIQSKAGLTYSVTTWEIPTTP